MNNIKLNRILATLVAAGGLIAAPLAVSDWSSIEGEGMEVGVFYQDRLQSSPYQGTSLEDLGLTGWAAVEGEGIELAVFHPEVASAYTGTSLASSNAMPPGTPDPSTIFYGNR
jgi:hypothetical protein